MKKKVVFMGTPQFSVPVLKMLIENYDVVLVVCQPDKLVGRKKEIVFSPIKKLAMENNIPLFQPQKIREDYIKIFEYKPDIIITCAYGQIIPKEVLEYPRYKCVNVHASLLPKLRGGAPIQHAIMDGYDTTGITIMYMDEKMDNGNIITAKELPILDTDTYDTLHDKLSILGKELLYETLPNIFNKTNNSIKQNEKEVTFGLNITKEDEKVDFNKMARQVFNHIRSLDSIPGAYAYLDNKKVKLFDCSLKNNKSTIPGQIINIYKDGIGISCIDGEIIIKKIQFEGKTKVLVKDFLNGYPKDKLINKIFE